MARMHLPKYLYHGTTLERAQKIDVDGYIEPGSGRTYENLVFFADNDSYARRVAFIKHGKQQGETIVVYRIHRSAFTRSLVGNGDKHISKSLSFGDTTYTYPERIAVHQEAVRVGSAPYTLNLPQGVSIMRDSKGSTGLSFTEQAAKEFGIERGMPGVIG